MYVNINSLDTCCESVSFVLTTAFDQALVDEFSSHGEPQLPCNGKVTISPPRTKFVASWLHILLQMPYPRDLGQEKVRPSFTISSGHTFRCSSGVI